MVRIGPKAPAQGTSQIADAIRQRRGARGLTPLDQTLLNAPEIAVSLDDWDTLWCSRLILLWGGRMVGTRFWAQ